MPKPKIPALAGTSEVAEILGVSKQRVNQLMAKDHFPKPVARLAATPVWLRVEMELYARARVVAPGPAPQ